MEPSTTALSPPPAALLAALPLAAWVCDARGRMTATNDHWNRYVGSTGALRSWWLSDRLVHPQDLGALHAKWQRARDVAEPLRAEVRLRRFDGDWRVNVVQLAELASTTRAERSWLGTWTDVEDLLMPVEQPRSIDQELEQIRSNIVATVGHELRTPLTSIYGMAVTLQRRDRTLPERARAQLLDIIVDQATRMAATIDDVLAASSIEHGTLHLQLRACDIGSIVRTAIGSIDTDSYGHSIRLQHPYPQLLVSVDPGRLRQALSNVVENAAKYSPGSGEVTVRIRRSGRYACVDVCDHGIGIDIDDHAHVFERFRRLDPGLTRGVTGTGLGLYIARELVRRMGGDVTLRSRPEHGSTFTLRLPTPG